MQRAAGGTPGDRHKVGGGGKALGLESGGQGAMKGALAQNMDPVLVEERLRQIPEYVRRFAEVFGPGGPWFEDASRALAVFQSTLVSRNAPFDRFMEGAGLALSASPPPGRDPRARAPEALPSISATKQGDMLVDLFRAHPNGQAVSRETP